MLYEITPHVHQNMVVELQEPITLRPGTSVVSFKISDDLSVAS